MREKKLGITVLAIVLVALFAFVACDGNKVNVANNGEVRFATGIRKATANSEWEAADSVGIFMADADDTLSYTDAATSTPDPERYNKQYRADTAAQTSGFTAIDAANTLKWDDITTTPKFDFIAYYPYVATITTPAALPISVAAPSAEQVTGTADFLWGRTDDIENNQSVVALLLNHKLSRLVVIAKPGVELGVNDLDSALTVHVTGLNTTATLDLNDGTLTPIVSVADIQMKDITTQADLDAHQRRYEVVVIPTAQVTAFANVGLRFTDVTASNTTYLWKASESVAEVDETKIHFDEGKQHVYNITLNKANDEVAVAEINIEIGDWEDGDGGNWGAVLN
ncbi:fimbrillin family protein [Parasphaerochaeta coccoides]|uniref:Fimbrillin family protein n=1 Tax=Parasphaerochaeta coccoides (strain ATCC BAA-1237 / DSM 17374 / SPN1) TaxID=760011 RepID=F4GIY1_PARC1|nr:fimbrillin family protein [Parasphaerochaeta coccoides]AEC02749.1 hypothetical protein Spico_1547 [Parasphaerochaeta coccoides DSM 17374]